MNTISGGSSKSLLRGYRWDGSSSRTRNSRSTALRLLVPAAVRPRCSFKVKRAGSPPSRSTSTKAFCSSLANSEAKRRRALFAWAFVNKLDFSAGRDHRLDSRFPRFDCLREGHNRYGYNVMQGSWRGRPMVGFDYHYETYSRDSKGRRTTSHYHFSAVVVTSEVELKPLIVRPEGALDKVAAFFGLDDIDFESAEFSRKFYVKSPDRRWAYDVIHPRTMEFLLAAPRFTIEMVGREVIAYRATRFAGPEEIAKAHLFFASELSSYVTGQVLFVDGGVDAQLRPTEI